LGRLVLWWRHIRPSFVGMLPVHSEEIERVFLNGRREPSTQGPQFRKLPPMPTPPVTRRWRRFLRFSVRAMIVVVLVIGAWMGWIVRQAHVQRDAVAVIRRAGCSVMYNWEWSDGRSIPGGKPQAPRWLVELVGVDYFGHVTVVGCSTSPSASDATLADIGRLTRLQLLYANSPSLGDAGLAHLKGLKKLTRLDLFGTRVTDAGLPHLTGLRKLSILGLGGTQVSDAGLAHLRGLNNVTSLALSNTQVTDVGLVHLTGLTKLKQLNLAGTQVTDAGLNELTRALPSLSITR
jgi:internalin A